MLEFIESKKIPKLQLDIHKDETDLEIAIQTAYEMDYKDIFLVGAIGNRLDHTIENIFILTKPIWENINFTITDGTQDIFLIRSEKTFPGKINDVVSLIPLTNVVSKVSTKGLYYPLQNEDLFLDRARGVSNLMISNEVQIQIRSGILVCFHIYKEIN
jgi:thiamine pyrophosphokinase